MRGAITRRGATPLLASLTNLSFVRLLGATGLSGFGDMLTTTGLALVVYGGRHSIIAVGVVFAARAIPSLVLGPLAGQLTDMLDRRRLMIAMDILRAALVATLPLVTRLGFAAVVAITAAVACATVLFQPARQAAVPEVLEENLLDGGNAAMATVERSAEILGYAAAGFIVLTLSAQALFVVDALTFAASAVLLAGLRLPAPERIAGAALARVMPAIADGFRHILADRKIRSILGISFFMVLFGSGIAPLTVPLALDKLGAGGGGFALLEASMAIGATAGAVTIGSRRSRSRALMISIGILGMGLTLLGMGLAPTLLLTATCFAANGFANMVYLVPLRSEIQSASAGPFRGRVIAAWLALVQLAILLGVGIGTFLSSLQRPAQVGRLFVLAGVVVIGLGLISLVRRPTPSA